MFGRCAQIVGDINHHMTLDLQVLRQQCPDNYRLVDVASDTKLFIREWQPQAASSTAVLIFHGITAHSKPYEFLAKPLAAAGIHVFGLDLRGHGLSDGIRGYYPSYESVISDLKLVLSMLKENFDHLVILGHSLGVVTSFFALNDLSDLFDGLILMSAARTPRKGIYPKRSLLTTLKYLVKSLIQPEVPIIKYYREGMEGVDDPLFNFLYTLKFLRIFSAKNVIVPVTMNQPLFFGIGDQDELFTVESAKALFDEIPTKDKEFHVFEGAKHAVFPADIVSSGIFNWLQTHFENE